MAWLWVGLLYLLATWSPLKAFAQTTSPPQLVISQLKVTAHDGQFITLYNPDSQALDLSKFRLEYFNNADPSKATSSKLIGLGGSLPSHGYYMINDGPLLLCYQAVVSSGSLGMSAVSGFLQLSHFESSLSPTLLPALDDYASWVKAGSGSGNALPDSSSAFWMRQPLDSANNPAVGSYGAGSWLSVQPDPNNSCGLITYTVSGSTSQAPSSFGLLLPSSPAPATIVSLSADSSLSSLKSLPPVDYGLMAPQLTELLPNPASPQTDADDEFVELYNSNIKPFDLSGFTLRVGLTTKHKYTFPSVTLLGPKSFKAFFSSDTGLSLSNSGGQAELSDPMGNTISQTDVYASAKDGQSWSAADGKWYWTKTATPNAANVINQASAVSNSGSGNSGKVRSFTSTASSQPGTTSFTGTGGQVAPAVHPAVVALVAALALLYGAYEYRHDLGNQLHRFRRYRASRRTSR